MRNSVFIVFTLIIITAKAQTFSKKIEGKVYSKNGDVAATHVLNTTLNKATITDIEGDFSINASVNDTIVFSAVQFKKKQMVVTQDILAQKITYILLEELVNELDEVVVKPFYLSGNIGNDLKTLAIEPVVTASTLGLPNAYVIPPTKAEREMFEAKSGGGLVPINPIINAITGRTKMLKERVARNSKYARTQRVRAFYVDSIYVKELNIPLNKIDDFMFFCEVDTTFSSLVKTHDKFKIWEFLKKKSVIYRKNNTKKVTSKLEE